MANGASNQKIVVASSKSVSGTGVIGEAYVNLPPEADEIGLVVKIESGTVAALTVVLQQEIEGTWASVSSVQTTNTSGAAVSFSGVPTTGKLRVNATTVTTPSSLVVSAWVIHGKKFD